MATHSNPVIFLSAGEASGDHYGAELIHALQNRVPGATFFGLGGTEMERAGQRRIIRAEHVAVMGITEILRHIPRIYLSYRKLVASIKQERPAVAVLIDFPDVNFRLARHCKRLGIPVVWFVSPQLWAWKRKRLRWVQQRVSRMMVIFPFEAAFYEARGVDAEFVGHPLASLPLPVSTREEYAAMYGLDMSKTWVALLPGSRRKEVEANTRCLFSAAELLEEDYPRGESPYQFIVPVASTLAPSVFEREYAEWESSSSEVGSKATVIHYVPDAREALHHARASVVASGTATVQALLIGNPFIVVYRVSKTTFALAKRLVKYPPEIPAPLDDAGNLPIAMVNLIAGKRIVPELINDRFTAQTVAEALKPFIADSPERRTMIADLAEARAKLFASGPGTPVERVANAVLDLLAPS